MSVTLSIIIPYEPLHNWCEQHTADLDTFHRNKGKFNYNAYMKGQVPYPELCRQICEFYAVPYHKNHPIEINKAFQRRNKKLPPANPPNTGRTAAPGHTKLYLVKCPADSG